MIIEPTIVDRSAIILWMFATLFAPVFGGVGTLLALIGSAAYLVLQYFFIGDSNPTELVTIGVASVAPLLVGMTIWGRGINSPGDETAKDRSYHELAAELSQVAGTSEVVINAIADGVLALDGQGTIQLINPAAQKIVGWGKHDALSLSYKSVLKIINNKNEEVNDMEDPVAKTLRDNSQVDTEAFSIETHSGKKLLASISVTPIGQIGSGVIVVFRDITHEKSEERQRAEFISTASHEMRTPVASIEGYLGLALNPATAQVDDKARDFITKAHASAQHLGRLFQDLLDVSKADDGRLQNTPAVVDVVPFIHDIVQGLTPKANEKGLRIMFKPIPDDTAMDDRRMNPVYYANVDNDHLREITNNLVENAIKYTPHGEVIVDVTGDAHNVVISITDTGIGIPKEDQGHLFQKFYRVDNTDTREIGGTGLGLYLCRRLAETMGGRIWVESEYKKGSTFFVEFPRIDHDEAMQLIEKASIEAERRATQDALRAQAERQLAASQVANSPVLQAMPQYQQAPAPQQPTPQPEPQQIPVRQGPPLPNTPLSSIEANPSQYVSRPQNQGPGVPPRQQ